MNNGYYLTAQEAAAALGISCATLYAYVSRGLIRSEPTGDRKRTRRYRLEDIQKLKRRKEQRRNPAKAVEGALDWGAPVLESELTLIADDHLYYRGYDVLTLVVNYSIEQVATLLWTGVLPDSPAPLFEAASGRLSPRCRAFRQQMGNIGPIEAFQTLLPLAAADDLGAYDLRPAVVAQTGAHILRLLATIAAGGEPTGAGIAQTLQSGWVRDDPNAAAAINTALILCADHELNVSSFTARCVASAGATPYEVVIAGLSALQGIKHGRMTERVAAFLQEVGNPEQAQAAVASRLKRGERIPGFGHRLYPQGDPRGAALLALAGKNYSDTTASALATAVVEAVFEVIGEHPTVDFGLVILAQALNLPPGSPIALFALGRTIGWIGHAIEQYQIDRMIRPRARYIGKPPKATF